MQLSQVALLALIAIAASAGIWLWFTGFATQSTGSSPVLTSGLKVEAISAKGSHLYIYVRNVGTTPLTLDNIYIWDSRGRLVATYKAVALSLSLSLRVWGGDVWDVSKAKQVEKGLIFYEDFESNRLDTRRWEIKTYNLKEGEIRVENGYLKITASSKRQGDYATYSIFTKSPINLPDSYTLEIELWKKSDAIRNYAVNFYIMQTNMSANPRYNTPWLMIGIASISNYFGVESEKALLMYFGGGKERPSDYFLGWEEGEERHAHIVVVVKEGYVVRTIAWRNDRSGAPYRAEYPPPWIPALYGNVYLALTVDTKETDLSEGWFGYVKIYKSTSFTLTGLVPGKEYVLAGSKGSCTIEAASEKLVIDPLDPPSGCEWLREEYYEHGYPMDIRISSKTFNTVLEPNQLKPLMLEVDLPPGTYTLKITTREGVSTTATVFIGGS